MGFDTTSEITFRKLSIFMTFMDKGNIARTAETLGLSGVSARCIPSKRTSAARSLLTKGVT